MTGCDSSGTGGRVYVGNNGLHSIGIGGGFHRNTHFLIFMRASVAFDDLPDRLGDAGIQRAVGVGAGGSGNKKNGARKDCGRSNTCESIGARR